jgi:type I restriction enzyme S subunit
VIPEDWEIKKLCDIGDSIIGLTYSPRNVSNYGKLVHRASNIQNNKLAYDDNVFVNLDINEKLTLRENDILICVRNGSRDLIGKTALIKGRSIGETFGAFMSVFRTKTYAPFLFYLIISNIVQKQINQSLGATINQITNKTLDNFRVPLPSREEEQTAIVTVLSDADALIESLEKLIAKKRAIKQGAMQEFLTGKKGLPGFSGEWEGKRIGDIFRVTRGQVLSMTKVTKEKIGEYKYPVYSSQTQKDGLAGYYKNYLFENCITWTTDGANAGEVKYRTGKFYCTNVCGVLESKGGYANLCVAAIFNSVSRKYVSYVGNPKLMNNTVADIILKIPKTVKEQSAIATVLSDMDAEIEKLEAKLGKYKLIKIGMMQQLLTGKIRII